MGNSDNKQFNFEQDFQCVGINTQTFNNLLETSTVSKDNYYTEVSQLIEEYSQLLQIPVHTDEDLIAIANLYDDVMFRAEINLKKIENERS